MPNVSRKKEGVEGKRRKLTFVKCPLYVEGSWYALPHQFSYTHRIYPIGTSNTSILQNRKLRHRETTPAQICSVNGEASSLPSILPQPKQQLLGYM